MPDVDADAQAQEVVDRRHPACVTARKVVVDGDQVDALAGEGVQVERQAGDQGLALTGLHLGDPALVEHDAAHQLDVEMAKADGAAARLPAERERLDQEVVEVLPLLRALPQLI